MELGKSTNDTNAWSMIFHEAFEIQEDYFPNSSDSPTPKGNPFKKKVSNISDEASSEEEVEVEEVAETTKNNNHEEDEPGDLPIQSF